MTRTGDWKLIASFGDSFDASGHYRLGPELALFHLSEDSGEETDLASPHPEHARELQRQQRTWIRAMGAEIPDSNPHHDPTWALRETRAKPGRN